MDNHSLSIAISGYGVVYPKSMDQTKAGVPGVKARDLPRKLARTASRSAAEAIAASEHAMTMAGISTEQIPKNFGLYVSQSGMQHSDFDDYENAFDDLNDTEKLNFQKLWKNRKLNPLIALNGLSNNILSLMSVQWKIKGDCAAFVRDEHGAGCALEEAFFSLKSGVVDVALVVVSGTSKDFIEGLIDCEYKDFNNECGAVAIVLQSQILQTKAKANCLGTIDEMALTYSKKKHATGKNPVNSSQHRWGGVVLGLVEILVSHAHQDHTNTIPIQWFDGYGQSCHLTISVGHEHEHEQL